MDGERVKRALRNGSGIEGTLRHCLLRLSVQ